MNGFLAPLNYARARDVMAKLDGYALYSEEMAESISRLLKESYPRIFGSTEQRVMKKGALLIEMAGANVNDPLVFVSHMDAREREKRRATAPMCRAHVVTLLEALEALIQEGYRPRGDLFIALSFDGLTGGEGARDMADYLRARGVSPCFVLDYGGYVTQSAFRTFLPRNAPLAMIGVTEKSVMRGELTAKEPLGKRRVPPLDRLLRAGSRLTRRRKRVWLCPETARMLRIIGRRAPFFRKLPLRHPYLFFPLMRVLWRGRAVIEQFFTSELTLTGVSQTGRGERAPDTASLSFRLSALPGDKLSLWKHRIKDRVRDDGVQMTPNFEYEASPVSRDGGPAWEAIETAIEILFERAVIVPCLSPYVTDGRFFAALKGNVCRFSPFLLNADEALMCECGLTDGELQTAVQFFRQMLCV